MWAEQIALCGTNGVRYMLVREGEHLPISCRVPGEFTVYNSLLAAAAALSLGVSGQDVIKALDSFEGVKGRMERVRGTEHLPYTVLIDYAHTPDALEKLLRCAREICPMGGKIRLVFGCGGDRDRSKRAAMARVASAYADVIYLTKDNSRSEDPQRILQDMIAGIPEGVAYIVISDRAQAIRQAMVDAQKGDILLLAGKGHEEYEIDRDGRHPFDERNIVRDVIADNADTDNDDTNT
jgi:UDP-N-acetylmuramoyl-L-alanyl-D-glutamate--2,6-diaminopimelate ligase